MIRQGSLSRLWPVVILFIVVLAACLIGICSRPAGFLASVWPANALMLGILLRLPGAASMAGWLAGAAAFMAADLLTEATFFKAAVLNMANLVSVMVAYRILCRLPEELLSLRQPLSMLYIMMAATLGGAAAGLIGGVASPQFFGGTAIDGFIFWWVTEVVNYAAVLPIFLSAPAWHRWLPAVKKYTKVFRKHDLLPALAVVLSCFMALLIGGPGAIAFPVLALLWCSLVYAVFPTAILTMSCSLFALLVISDNHLLEHSGSFDKDVLLSIRLGVAVIAIAPIMLSIVIRNRNELLAELRYLATHDALTGIGSRPAFCKDAQRILSRSQKEFRHAIMMIDLDHFKQINDSYGHAAGDEVLCEIARRISSCLRVGDQFGRMGGEEFAVFLQDCQPEAAKEIAERIRKMVELQPVIIKPSLPVNVTTSIGLTFTRQPGSLCLDSLLAEADEALYKGKSNGRNRVEVFSIGEMVFNNKTSTYFKTETNEN